MTVIRRTTPLGEAISLRRQIDHLRSQRPKADVARPREIAAKNGRSEVGPDTEARA